MGLPQTSANLIYIGATAIALFPIARSGLKTLFINRDFNINLLMTIAAIGAILIGDTLEAAVFAIEELEETAKLYLLLRGLNPRYLSPEQVADLTKVFGLTLPEHGR